MDFPILYSRAKSGAIQTWQIFVEGNKYWTVAGQQGGSLTTSAPTECFGKNVGKANETTDEKQAEIDALAKHEKKMRANYFEDISMVDEGFLKPQLAKPCADYIEDVNWSGGRVLDDKLNGFACVILDIGAFTRANKQYHAIPHILRDFETFRTSFPNAYIQGELFNAIYVTQLNRISELISVIRQPKDLTPELLAESERIVQFHWYDGYGFEHPLTGQPITKDTPLIHRRQAINDWIKVLDRTSIKPVHFDIVYSEKEAWDKANEYIAKGGEGKILKNPHAIYQHGRTKDLLKLKKQESEEFKVIRIEEGKGKNKGMASKVWLENPKGVRPQDKEFKSNIKGEDSLKKMIYVSRDKYPGKFITCEFQERSEYGVPQIPYTDMVLREEVEGKGTVNAK